MPQLESAPGPEVTIDGRRYLYFVGTGYLSLHGHPKLVDATCQAAREFGLCAATSRMGFGNQPALLQLEKDLAHFFGHAAATTFPSAYAGPSILASALSDRFDVVLIDEHAHFSVRDAAKAAGLPSLPFRHLDAEDLSRQIQHGVQPEQRVLLTTDGVFSSTGDLPPLVDYLTVLDAHGGSGILIDDAHGVGVLGANGRGTLEHLGMKPHRYNTDSDEYATALFSCATLSKAFGAYGGFISGSEAFIASARAASHWYDGSNPLPSPIAAAASASLQLLTSEADRLERLRSNSQYARRVLRGIGLHVPEAVPPIISFEIGDAQNMKAIQVALMGQGIAIGYALYAGTGAHGSLRLAIQADHSEAMIDRLAHALAGILP